MVTASARWILTIVCLDLGFAGAASHAGQPGSASHSVPVNDTKVYESFQAGLARLLANGRSVKIDVLLGQLRRDHHSLALPNTPKKKMTLAELYQSCKNSVLVVGHLYHCTECGRRHVTASGGFALTASGVIATNYHVVNKSDSLALGAMTADGKVYAVKEVLAADKEGDVAILQLDGSGLAPLPLAPEVAVGASVAVIGHPGHNFFTLTPGVISHYFAVAQGGREVPWIAATAAIGSGSSGAPLLNESGAVVAMASQTHLIQTTKTENHQPSPQMTVGWFVPAETILRLVGPNPKGAPKQPKSR